MVKLKINKINIKKEFESLFPWHYDPTLKNNNDCPDLGHLTFEFKELEDYLIKQCKTQDPKTSGKGFSRYFDQGKIKQSEIDSRDEQFKKLFATWIASNWTLDNSCYYEFHDEELGDFYKPLLEAYQNKFGELKSHQLRANVRPPMTALGLHSDTFGAYRKKYDFKQSQVFRALTFISNWEWGHYTLIGNTVCHQYKAGSSVQIKPNVPHCTGNIGFNPQITMNITGIKNEI